MASFVCTIAKGRVVELYRRVDTADPANCALVIVALQAGSTDDALKDADTLAAILALTPEVTNSGYSRKTLTGASLDAFTTGIDDTNNWLDLDIPDQTWSSVASGTNWARLVICYDEDTTSGTDANIVPLTVHDFAVTPDGSSITAQIDAEGFFRAQDG